MPALQGSRGRALACRPAGPPLSRPSARRQARSAQGRKVRSKPRHAPAPCWSKNSEPSPTSAAAAAAASCCCCAACWACCAASSRLSPSNPSASCPSAAPSCGQAAADSRARWSTAGKRLVLPRPAYLPPREESQLQMLPPPLPPLNADACSPTATPTAAQPAARRTCEPAPSSAGGCGSRDSSKPSRCSK